MATRDEQVNVKRWASILELRKFYSYEKKRFNLFYWLVPIFLYLLASLFEGVTVFFLLPLTKGIISGDFISMYKALFSKVPFPSCSYFLNSNTAIFSFLVVIIFVSSFLKIVLQYAATLNISYKIRKFTSIMRQVIFSRYLSFGKMFFDRNNLGNLQTVLINFTTMVSAQLKGLEQSFSSLFLLIVYLIAMLVISWRLTLLVLLIYPVINFGFKWLIKKIRRSSESYAHSYSLLSNNISNILSCIPLVKLYTREEFEKKEFSDLSSQIAKIEFSIDKKQALINPMHEIVMLLMMLLIISAIAFMTLKERIGDISSYLAFFFLLKRAASSFSSLNNIRTAAAVVSGQVSALLKVLNDDEKFFLFEGNGELVDFKENIEIRDLSFSYIKENKILQGVSFTVEKGSKVAIVGPTGAGKTTLVSLILRFYDCEPGKILIDGKDIRSFTLKSLRARMALVSQEALLFNDTIRNNITYGLGRRICDQELIEVTKRARLFDMITRLPDTFNTVIGDKGVRLSGGEKQRLSIARAMLKNSEILILDEATSSLDTETEKLIQEAIDEAMINRTNIVIAHRLSTIKNADKIIVIENGMLVEQGSLNALLQNKGKFYDFWQMQKFY